MNIKLISSINQQEIKVGDTVQRHSAIMDIKVPVKVNGIKYPDASLKGGLISVQSDHSPFSNLVTEKEIDVEWCVS
jgi:hypothetical protein